MILFFQVQTRYCSTATQVGICFVAPAPLLICCILGRDGGHVRLSANVHAYHLPSAARHYNLCPGLRHTYLLELPSLTCSVVCHAFPPPPEAEAFWCRCLSHILFSAHSCCLLPCVLDVSPTLSDRGDERNTKFVVHPGDRS